MSDNNCPWCEKPVDLRDPAGEEPVTVLIPAFEQVTFLHGSCGAALFDAGLQQRPRELVRRRHPARIAQAGGAQRPVLRIVPSEAS